MIEAHVCFTGEGWQTFVGAKPENLNCEFEDHRTCEAAGMKLQEIEDGKCLEIKEIEQARRERAIAAATIEATEKAENDLVVKAGWLKSQALREIGLSWDEDSKRVAAESAKEIAKVLIVAKAQAEALEAECSAALAGLDKKRALAEAEVAETDWAAKVEEAKEAAIRG